MKDYMEAYLDHLQKRHLAPETLRFKSIALKQFMAWNNKKDVRDTTLKDIRGFQDYLDRVRKPNGELNSVGYQHSLVWVIKDFFTYFHKRGDFLINPCVDLPPLRKPKRLPKGVITAAQVNKLLAQPNIKTLWGFRDRTILELLYSSGLRGAEICNFTVYDFDFKDKTARIIQGKGRKDRIVPVGKTALSFLDEYLKRVRPTMLKQFAGRGIWTKVKPSVGDVIERLFFSRKRQPMSTRGHLYKIIKRYAEEAGLGEEVTTHSLRHACATEMLKAGANIRHVQELLGHNHISTTQVYTHVLPYNLREIHARTAPSERRRKIEVPKFGS